MTEKFYRFADGSFQQAATFEQAKVARMQRLLDEQEDPKRWHNCMCLGFGHRYGCPEMNKYGIPF